LEQSLTRTWNDLARAPFVSVHFPVDVRIVASNIETGVVNRDADLKLPDFLDVAQYPDLRFVGRRVHSGSGAEIDLIGDLTIQGTTCEAVLGVESSADRRGTFAATCARHSHRQRRSIVRTSGSQPGAGDRRGLASVNRLRLQTVWENTGYCRCRTLRMLEKSSVQSGVDSVTSSLVHRVSEASDPRSANEGAMTIQSDPTFPGGAP